MWFGAPLSKAVLLVLPGRRVGGVLPLCVAPESLGLWGVFALPPGACSCVPSVGGALWCLGRLHLASSAR